MDWPARGSASSSASGSEGLSDGRGAPRLVDTGPTLRSGWRPARMEVVWRSSQ